MSRTDDKIIVYASYPVRGDTSARFELCGAVSKDRWNNRGGTIMITVISSYAMGVPAFTERLPLPGDKIRIYVPSVYMAQEDELLRRIADDFDS